MNKYSFTTIIEEDEKGKKCGTQLFYDYLVNKGYITKYKSINTFVELTRLEDTWDWKHDKKYGIQAHDLAILFNSVGIDNYLDIIIKTLSSNKNVFKLDESVYDIINNKKKEYEKTVLSIINEMEYFIDEQNNKYGAVFANYEYRNEIADYVKENMELGLKYLIIVALDKEENGQKSYRKIDDNFDVNVIASKYGGGGHPGAAAVNITKSQKEIIKTLSKKEALEYICNSSYII